MGASVDGVLVEWGERLFYPANRRVPKDATPRLTGTLQKQAAAMRRRIQATVSRKSVQVMVKVTGGGRGMAAIAAHFRYISKAGKLEIEDDRGEVRHGKEALHDLVEQWRHGGVPIDEVGHRREAFNIMLSMPRGTDAQIVLEAARAFGREELLGHRYVMVLHDHQANPHVHLSVKASSMLGDRLNPRKTDLHRWRETFAEKLRGYGIEAEASRQATRGVLRQDDPLWRVKARDEERLRDTKGAKGGEAKPGRKLLLTRVEALRAWGRIIDALAASELAEDHRLAGEIRGFVQRQPITEFEAQIRQRQWEQEPHRQEQRQQDISRTQEPTRQAERRPPDRDATPSRGREGPEISR
jgi:hypothetical protein